MNIETDLNKIKILGKKKEKENFRFRSYLKNLEIKIEEIDKIVHKINDEVTSQIDCTKCGNCCKSVKPILDNEDINKFAEGLKITPKEMLDNYCKVSKEERDKYEFKGVPCPFLKENKCTNYEDRPKDCQSYPHLQKEDFVFRIWGVIDNYSICPIVFNVFEILKEELWNRNWRKSIEY
jgi:hypothetical protein